MNTRALFRWMLSTVVAVGLLGAIGLALKPPVQAQAAVVVHDWPGLLPPCNASLQQCIDAAIVQPGDAIHIKPGVYTQSVTLAKPVSLVGDNAQATILNAEPFQRVLTVTNSTITSSVIISGFTLAHGNPQGPACPDACGGGILISGAARPTLQNIALVQNTASQGGGLWVDAGPGTRLLNVAFISNTVNGSNAFGGGAFINGFARIENGRFVSNTANGEVSAGGGLYAMSASVTGTLLLGNSVIGSAGSGGGMYMSSGPSDLSNVTLNGNRGTAGGALYAGGLLSLTDVMALNNTASNYGGGVYGNLASLIVTRGRYEGNVANLDGGAFYASGPLTLMAARVSHNTATVNGGGVYAGGTVWITNTLLIQNSAQTGGGLYQAPAGDAHIVNALFARNQSTLSQTAAIVFAATGSFSMVHSTIVDNVPNQASAISIDNGNAAADIRDSIISGHAVGINLISGGTFEDYNLYFGNSTNISGPVTIGSNSIPNANPQFADPFNDDYHLRFTSPAMNAGINVGVNFDIDGQPRPIGPGFDIGFDETGSTIQQLIDVTPPGGTVNIPAGVYTESLTLYKPVNLIGAGVASTIIRAAVNDRVLTVTGNTISTSTLIADLTLSGGRRLTGGCPDACGGGVLVTGFAYPTLNNVFINDNQAFNGGGLYIQTGGARLVGTTVVGNSALQSGGGAYVESASARLDQISGTFGGNNAVDGAGVFVQAGLFQANGGVLYGNQATNWGGGMLIGNGGSIRTDATQLISNSANNAGGGVFVDVGSAELLNNLIMSNTATEGGGVYVRDLGGTTASLVGGKVEGNAANGYGGGVYAGGTLYITGTRFFDNRAYDGSALEITGTARARVVNAFIARNPANGAFPSTNASARFDSSGNSVVLHTTFGNATQPLTRALAVNSGVVTVANTIVATYTNGLSRFGGQLAEDYNLFFGTPITFTGSISHGGHNVLGRDPLFKDAVNNDYHLKGLSPAVNRGTNVGVRRDIDQDARPLGGGFDIGADEASVAGITPGPNTGGQFTYTTTQNSTIYLNVPPGAVTSTVPIYCSLIESDTVPIPNRWKLAGIIFELDADLDPVNVVPGSILFNVPVTLSLGYTDAQLASAGITDELQLKLYRFETPPFGIGWCEVGVCRPGESQIQDTQNNLITATVLGFSRFGGMSKASSGTDIFLPLIMRN